MPDVAESQVCKDKEYTKEYALDPQPGPDVDAVQRVVFQDGQPFHKLRKEGRQGQEEWLEEGLRLAGLCPAR